MKRYITSFDTFDTDNNSLRIWKERMFHNYNKTFVIDCYLNIFFDDFEKSISSISEMRKNQNNLA